MKSKKLGKYPCLVGNFLNHISRGQLREAVDTLPQISRKGIRLNSKAIASLIRQCADSKSLQEGKLVHIHLKITGSKHPNTFLANHLINMYAKCGNHVKAREVFDKMRTRNLYSWNNMLSGYAHLGMVKAAKRLFDGMPERDFVSWNTMVMAYVEMGMFDEALNFYMQLRRLDIGFNEYTFAGVMTICLKLRELWLAKQLHCQVFLVGFLSNVVLSSSLVDDYAKCGELGDARRLFEEMSEKDVLTWTTLVSGYAQCREMKLAQEMFDKMPNKNLVSWNVLISGYVQNRMAHDALKLFSKMIILCIEPDQFTFSSCLCACATGTLIEIGRQMHSHLIKSGLRPNAVVVSSVIDMYSKCGELDVAKRVFDTVEDKGHVALWNTIISALAHHNCGKQAMKMFTNMVMFGVKPDSVTFAVTLDACRISGLVQEGLRLFESMAQDYNIIPDQEHYACLIYLLGSFGRFDEMMSQLKEMPSRPDDRVWNALFDVCRIHGNEEIGRIITRHLVQLESQCPVACLLLSCMYASVGRWESAQKVRQLMNQRDFEKGKALNWLEVDRKLRLDTSHNKLHQTERGSVLELLTDQNSL